MSNLCIIPARGGSKRIPNKNLINFHGKPLIAYTIEAAIKSKLFGKNIYISSDSEKILAMADKYQVRKIKRPKNISGDRATLEQAALHLLENSNQRNRYLCMLLPNCPLRTAEDICKSYELITQNKATCIMSVVKYHWLYPFWALQEKNGRLHKVFGNKFFKDSWRLPQEVYCPSGAVRWVKVKNFLKEKSFYGRGLIKFEVPFERSADIDTYEDLELAKKLYKLI